MTEEYETVLEASREPGSIEILEKFIQINFKSLFWFLKNN